MNDKNHRNPTFLNVNLFGTDFVGQVQSTIIKKKSEHYVNTVLNAHYKQLYSM